MNSKLRIKLKPLVFLAHGVAQEGTGKWELRIWAFSNDYALGF